MVYVRYIPDTGEVFEITNILPTHGIFLESESVQLDDLDRYDICVLDNNSILSKMKTNTGRKVVILDKENIQQGIELSEREIQEIIQGMQISELEIQLLELQLGGM